MMNKYQEIIEYFGVRVINVLPPRNRKELSKANAILILELVDKATPKKPNKLDYKLLLDEGWRYECPICKCAIGINTNAFDYTQEEGYCPTCGQALDWSNDE